MAGAAESAAVGFYADAFSLVGQAVHIFTSHRGEFTMALVIAVALAAICWIVASNYSRLWNLRFRTTRLHHILCLFAALCTLVFAVFYASLKYTKQAADLAIDRWRDRLTADQTWGKETFKRAYYEVKKLGLEDFSNYPPPEQGGNLVPLGHLQSRKKSAEVHVNAAVRHFQGQHPFLNKMLWARSSIPTALIDQRINEFFRLNPGKTFPFSEAINIAAREIKSDLQTQTQRIVPTARLMLFLLFLVAQLIPFGIIGYAAYKDLKVTT
jgi:hypothetical protein